MFDFINGWYAYLAIWIILILLFERVLYCGVCIDDVVRVKRLKELKSKLFTNGNINWFSDTNVTGLFSRNGYPGFIFEACYGAGLFNTMRQEYLFNAVLHGINCSLIYSITGSFLGSILYLINPVNNQTTIWSNGRRYALSILLVLIAWKFPLLSLIAYPAAMFIGVSALLMPVLFLFTKYWAIALIALVIGAIVNYHRILKIFVSRKSEFIDGNENQAIKWQKIILYIKSVGYNLIHCIFPIKPAMYHDFLFYFSANKQGAKEGYSLNADFYKGVVALSLIAYLVIVQNDIYAFWFLIFISPWCNLIQVTMNASDRYCSLPNVGVMIVLAHYLEMLPSPYNWIAVTFFATLYVSKYMPLFRAYTAIENFYLYHLHINPCLIDPRYWLAKLYVNSKDPYSAYALIKKGLRFRPTDFKLLIAMLEVYLNIGNNKGALECIEKAQHCIPLGEEEETMQFFNSVREKLTPKPANGNNPHNPMMGINVHNNGKPLVNK